jgi:hypothetical protein
MNVSEGPNAVNRGSNGPQSAADHDRVRKNPRTVGAGRVLAGLSLAGSGEVVAGKWGHGATGLGGVVGFLCVIAVWGGVALLTVGAAAITGGQPRTGSGRHGTQSTTSILSRQAYAIYAGLVAGIFVLFAATNVGNVWEADHRGAVTTGTVAQGVSVLSRSWSVSIPGGGQHHVFLEDIGGRRVGAKIVVRYDRAHPWHAVVDARASGFSNWSVPGAFTGLAVVAIAFGVVQPGRRRRSRTQEPQTFVAVMEFPPTADRAGLRPTRGHDAGRAETPLDRELDGRDEIESDRRTVWLHAWSPGAEETGP